MLRTSKNTPVRKRKDIAREAYPMMEWSAQDFLRIVSYIEFLKEDSPTAQHKGIVWRETLKDNYAP